VGGPGEGLLGEEKRATLPGPPRERERFTFGSVRPKRENTFRMGDSGEW